jgi:hypothetical protein
LFSLPLNCSEGNSERLILYLFNGTEFRVVFSSAEGFGTEFRGFSVPRNSRNSFGNNHLFRLSEIPNPIRRLDGEEEDTIVLEDDGVEGTFAQRIGDWDSFNFPEDLFATQEVRRKRTKFVVEYFDTSHGLKLSVLVIPKILYKGRRPFLNSVTFLLILLNFTTSCENCT